MRFDERLLTGISVLAAVVEAGNFARAAEALNITPSGVSRAIARLEERLGIRLLHRTTRSLRLSAEGEQFYATVIPLLDGIESAASTAAGAAEQVSGSLKVAIDPYFTRLIVSSRLPEFAERYPDIQLEIITRIEPGDLVGEGIDVSVRFGAPPDSSMVARPLLHTRILTVAAPAYLERKGIPSHPTQLLEHNCLQFRDPISHQPFTWEFRRGQELLDFATQGNLIVNDASALINACLAGAGVAQMKALGVQHYLASGELVELFPDWPDERFPLYVIYPTRRHPAAKVRAFIHFCQEICQGL